MRRVEFELLEKSASLLAVPNTKYTDFARPNRKYKDTKISVGRLLLTCFLIYQCMFILSLLFPFSFV